MSLEASSWSPLTRAWAGEDAIRSTTFPLFDWLVPLTILYLRTYCRLLTPLPTSAMV